MVSNPDRTFPRLSGILTYTVSGMEVGYKLLTIHDTLYVSLSYTVYDDQRMGCR